MGRSGNRADVTEPVRYPGRRWRYGEDDDQLPEGRPSRDVRLAVVSEEAGFEEDVITEVSLPLAEQETVSLQRVQEVVPYKPRLVSSPLPITRSEGPRYTRSTLAHRPQAHQSTPPFQGYVPSTRPLPPLEPQELHESPASRQWIGAVVVVASLTGLVLLAMAAGGVALGWP